LAKVRSGAVDPATVRARYFDAFDLEAAHADWLDALGLRPRAHAPQAAVRARPERDVPVA
jgi:hypothetical protein